VPIVSNQVRISLHHLEPIYEGLDWGGATSGFSQPGNGVLDQCMAMNMTPLAYSRWAEAASRATQERRAPAGD
jgi:predicted oxidoreductase